MGIRLPIAGALSSTGFFWNGQFNGQAGLRLSSWLGRNACGATALGVTDLVGLADTFALRSLSFFFVFLFSYPSSFLLTE